VFSDFSHPPTRGGGEAPEKAAGTAKRKGLPRLLNCGS